MKPSVNKIHKDYATFSIYTDDKNTTRDAAMLLLKKLKNHCECNEIGRYQRLGDGGDGGCDEIQVIKILLFIVGTKTRERG